MLIVLARSGRNMDIVIQTTTNGDKMKFKFGNYVRAVLFQTLFFILMVAAGYEGVVLIIVPAAITFVTSAIFFPIFELSDDGKDK